MLLLGLVVLGGLAAGLVRLARRDAVPVLHPLTAEDLTPPLPRWVVPVLIAPLAVAVASALALALTQR